jgi:hypothetical protein
MISNAPQISNVIQVAIYGCGGRLYAENVLDRSAQDPVVLRINKPKDHGGGIDRLEHGPQTYKHLPFIPRQVPKIKRLLRKAAFDCGAIGPRPEASTGLELRRIDDLGDVIETEPPTLCFLDSLLDGSEVLRRTVHVLGERSVEIATFLQVASVRRTHRRSRSCQCLIRVSVSEPVQSLASGVYLGIDWAAGSQRAHGSSN